ncbi:DUF2207 family protein [Microbacterium sp. A84]|uniref:DUF2207 family protein n=1 Tax=Microbacterium sp. A84 TaxID=3450715 RepID=UPI003F434574
MLVVALVLGLVPALALLVLAIVARVRATRMPSSTGAQFAPAPGATVLYDAFLVRADRKAVPAALIDMAVQRKIRLLAPTREKNDGTRAPIGVEVIDGAVFSADELAVLEALFGPGHASGRVRRFTADGRAQKRTLRTLMRGVEKRLADAGLLQTGRAVWPVVLIRIFGWITIVVSFILFSVALSVDDGAGDPATFGISFGAFLVAIAAVSVVPRPWRRFLAPAEPLRAHLAGLREYIALAETEPLRFSQSVHGAEMRGDVSAEARQEKLERYLLNERLLPYAVLFGLETSWAKILKTESEELGALNVADGVLGVAGSVFEVIELVGGVVMLVSAVGDMVDATGGVVEVVGGVFEAVGGVLDAISS